MYHLYTMHLKSLSKDVQTMFWSLCFPIILATLFHAAFSNLSTVEAFNTVSVAVVKEDGYEVDTIFLDALKNSTYSNKNKLFTVSLTTKKEAVEMLEDNTISGYIITGDTIKLVVKNSGINETIIKSFLDSYSQTEGTIATLSALNPEISMEQLISELEQPNSFLYDLSNQGENPNTSIVYFYALIAMTCLMGSNWGNKVITDIQADLSPKGARIQVSPIHKLKLLLCNLCAAFTIHFINIGILMLYLYYILKVDFSNNLYHILITCFFSGLVGVMLGAMITAVVKKNDNIKQSLLTLISVGGSALAGLMVVDLKYIVDTQLPFVAFLNPASLITDALYRLYYYGPDARFYLNISILFLMSFIFTVITYWSTRRKEYASI